MRAVVGLVALAFLFVHAIARADEPMSGVGMVIVNKGGAIEVVRVVDGSPAAKAGIMRGMRIVEVDGQPVAGKRATEVGRLVRGAPGTSVEITTTAATVTLVRGP